MTTKLPDPDEFSDRDVIIYDGECHFCIAGVRRLRQLDVGQGKLAFLSLHDPRVAERYSNLGHDELMGQMYVVDTHGDQHGGSDAVKYLSRRLPILWPAMPLLHLPGTAGLWRTLYHTVAKNRYQISKRFFGGKDACETGTCSINRH